MKGGDIWTVRVDCFCFLRGPYFLVERVGKRVKIGGEGTYGLLHGKIFPASSVYSFRADEVMCIAPLIPPLPPSPLGVLLTGRMTDDDGVAKNGASHRSTVTR